MKLDFESKAKLAFVAIVAALGIILRLLFIDRTDITGDEAFYAMFSFKIAQTLLTNALVIIALVAAVAIFCYFAFVRKSWKITVAILALALVAKFAFNIPYLFYTPELFIILQSFGIALTGLKAGIVGELISTLSSIGIAIAAYFICKELWNEKAGIFAFALLMLSPFGIFMSASSFRDYLGMFLAIASLAFFLRSFKAESFSGNEISGRIIAGKKAFLPIAGFLLALGIATRETVLAFLPVFALTAWSKKEELFSKERKKEVLICVSLIIFATAFYLPLNIESSKVLQNFIARYGDGVNDLTGVHYSTFIAQGFGLAARAPDVLFYARLSMLFYTPLIILTVIAGMILILKNRRIEQLSILLLLLIFAAWFSILQGLQRPNYMLEIEFPLMAVSAVMLAGFRKFNTGSIVFVVLIALFVFQSAAIIQQHDFKGFSQAISSIPQDKTIFADSSNIAAYYRGIFALDTEVGNAFFKKFFPPNPEKQRVFEEKKKLILADNKKYASREIDYAIVSKRIEEFGYAKQDFKLCRELKSNNVTIFWLYANKKNECV